MKNLYVTLHNVFGSQKIREMTDIFLGFKLETFVISKAVGSAATVGVPESQKLIFQKGKNLLFVADLPDAIELLKPDKIYTFIEKSYAQTEFNVEEVIASLKNDLKVMLVFAGSKPGLSKKELDMGSSVFIDVPGDIGSIGYATIALYKIYCFLNKE